MTLSANVVHGLDRYLFHCTCMFPHPCLVRLPCLALQVAGGELAGVHPAEPDLEAISLPKISPNAPLALALVALVVSMISCELGSTLSLNITQAARAYDPHGTGRWALMHT